MRPYLQNLMKNNSLLKHLADSSVKRTHHSPALSSPQSRSDAAYAVPRCRACARKCHEISSGGNAGAVIPQTVAARVTLTTLRPSSNLIDIPCKTRPESAPRVAGGLLISMMRPYWPFGSSPPANRERAIGRLRLPSQFPAAFVLANRGSFEDLCLNTAAPLCSGRRVGQQRF